MSRDSQFLLANAYFANKQKFEIRKNDLVNLIKMKTPEEKKRFLHQFNYEIEIQDLGFVETIDAWVRKQEDHLKKQYREYNCEDIIEPLFISEQLFKEQYAKESHQTFDFNILKVYANELKTACEAQKIYYKVKIDQLLCMRYLRFGECEELFLMYATGYINREQWERLNHGREDMLKKVLTQEYGNLFEEAIREYLDNKKLFWIHETFEIALARKLEQFRFTVIGKDGLFFNAFRVMSELHNIRLILKAQLYYFEQDLQVKMVRDIYV